MSQGGRSYRGLLWCLAVVGLALDQVGKYGVFRWQYGDGNGGEFVIVPGWFKFSVAISNTPAEGSGLLYQLRTWSGPNLPRVNHGALFGLLQDYHTLANLIFAGISLSAAIVILWWSTRPSATKDGILSAALGLILAGTLGNLYDRLVFNGVRDFLYFHYIEWPVFNIADCCLVCGAGLLLLQAIWHAKPVEAPADSSSAALAASAK